MDPITEVQLLDTFPCRMSERAEAELADYLTRTGRRVWGTRPDGTVDRDLFTVKDQADYEEVARVARVIAVHYDE